MLMYRAFSLVAFRNCPSCQGYTDGSVRCTSCQGYTDGSVSCTCNIRYIMCYSLQVQSLFEEVEVYYMLARPLARHRHGKARMWPLPSISWSTYHILLVASSIYFLRCMPRQGTHVAQEWIWMSWSYIGNREHECCHGQVVRGMHSTSNVMHALRVAVPGVLLPMCLTWPQYLDMAWCA